MKKSGFFMTYLLMSAVSFILLLIISLVLTIVGAFGIEICLYIGLALLALYVVLCLINAARLTSMLNYRSDDDPKFNEMMDSLTADPKAYLKELMEQQDQNKALHGEALLALDDDDLFEAVYLQNLEIAEETEDEENELNAFSGARRTVYVLGLFDAEVQNGGLCQFFVNSSSEVAPFVSECLEAVGAAEHRGLFDEFISANAIDLSDLSSFKIQSRRAYIKQTKRFDFDAFDDRYYELPELQSFVTAYIRANIIEF